MSARREERKVVTCLFCDLVGFTSQAESMDPEDVAAVLRGYHEHVRGELERYGGTVEKFIGDAVMALFGAPVAHEDDPERAVRAGLAIRDWAREQDDLQVRIGVTTGEALVSLDASPDRGEGMASGDVVNTASRLQAAAPANGILVAETTYRATARAIDYREALPVEAKGKAEPVPVWEVLEARARYGIDPFQSGAPLVGRKRELARLSDALAAAREERQPQLVTLVGVPGIGKSRLVYELFQAVERDPELINWRQGRSLPYGESVTFSALTEMVKAQAGILENDSADAAERKLAEATGAALAAADDREWVFGHLRPLVGLGGEGELGGDRRQESFAAWRRFFEALAAQRALVLVFEDLHWAGDDVLDFVDYLVDWASGVPLLVVCTARPELLDRRAAWGGGKSNATTLSLSPLSDEETARLVHDLLGRAVLPADVQSTLLARAEGNPLYAEEFARIVEERGVPSGDGDLPLPESLQGIVAARLDGLSGEEKELLQDSAVLGKVFWTGALAHVGGRESWSADEKLHRLERKEFVRRDHRSAVAGESQFAFRHLLVRDVAYAQIPRAQRAEKHRLAAGWIESLSPDRSEERAEMLAHHYLQALELGRAAGVDTDDLSAPAATALREAGDRALALNSFAAAARYYEQALELLPDDVPERADVLLRCGQAKSHLGDDEALGLVEAARDAYLVYEQAEKAALAALAAVDGLWFQGKGDAATAEADRAVALVEPLPPSRTKALALVRRARLGHLAGAADEWIAMSRTALAMAQELGLDDVASGARNTIGMARVAAGDDEGLDDLRRSLELARRSNNPLLIHLAHNNLANMLWLVGRLDEAADELALGRESDERFGSQLGIRWFESEQVPDLDLRGEWGAALARADRVIAEAEHSPHYNEASSRWVRSWLRLAQGDLDGALRDSGRALELARERKEPQVLCPALAHRGFALLAGGNRAEAKSTFDELLRSDDIHLLIAYHWLTPAGPLAFDLGRGDELAAIEASRSTPWLEALLGMASGDFEAAAGIFEGIRARGREAYARLRAGEVLSAAGRSREADVQLRLALQFFREQGTTAYASRAESLLAATA
jgi:class 3 adenylate cyclase/tetratricopeptide (TPR) repeat protein